MELFFPAELESSLLDNPSLTSSCKAGQSEEQTRRKIAWKPKAKAGTMEHSEEVLWQETVCLDDAVKESGSENKADLCSQYLVPSLCYQWKWRTLHTLVPYPALGTGWEYFEICTCTTEKPISVITISDARVIRKFANKGDSVSTVGGNASDICFLCR